MRKLVPALGIVALAAAAQVGLPLPAVAQAQVVYRWCAHYGGRDMGGAANCGFVTYQQCMATIAGMGGYCAENPFYNPPPRRGREYMRAR